MSILTRKDEHLDLALQQGRSPPPNPFDAIRLQHCALPEVDLDDIDLTTQFLGRSLPLPFLMSSMTGGPARGGAINANLATAAEALQIPFAVGSQRIALEGGSSVGLDRQLRRLAPTTAIWANFGAAQLLQGWGIEAARRAIDMIAADALIIHLNPLQEAVQPGGDTRWHGVTGALEQLARQLEVPLIVKEVGYGISAAVARRLVDCGVAAIDVAGSGGTAWALIEGDRSRNEAGVATGRAFSGWGLTTPESIRVVRAAFPQLPLIGSGGIRHGVDAAKALALGADIVGQAAQVLPAALESAEAILDHFQTMARQVRIACFATGSPNLAALRNALTG